MHSLVIVVAIQGPTPMKRNFDFGLYVLRLSNLATYAKTGNGTLADGFSL
jgi:hypothetical protein